MKSRLIISLSVFFTLICQHIKADTIGEMLTYCQKPDENFFRSYCHQYISGVIDIQASYGLTTKNETINTCFPDGFTSRQGAAIFVKWAKANPELHHLLVHQGVVASLHETFPCSKK